MLILVVILVLVLSRIFKGTTIAYTELKPSYSKYLEMRNDPDVLNMKCSVTNDTLTYDAFTTYSYKKADACEWVKADLAKSAVLKTENEYFLYDVDDGDLRKKIIRRDLLGKTSACKTLKKTDSCEAINEDCVRGHALVEQLLSTMKIANFPLKELLDSESKLLTFVNSTLTQSLQSLLSGLEGPRIAVKQWASKNMPVLYGYLGSMQSYVQGQAFQNDYTSDFYKRVQAACTVYNEVIAGDDSHCTISSIGDGECNDRCNNAYCLYDGGDCLNGGSIFEGNSNGKWIYNDENGWEFKYRAFSPLQQGDELFENPYYNTSNASIYTDAVIKELKELKNADDKLVFDSNEDSTVTDEELENSYIFNSLSEDPIWQSLPNNFVGFDPENTCGNPSTWYKSYELNRPESWFTGLKDNNKDFFELVLKEKLYPALGYPSGVSVPTGDVPTQSTDVFSCDGLSQSHNIPGIVGVTSADIKVWIDYTYAVFQYVKDKCVAGTNAGEWATPCLDMGTLNSSFGVYNNFQFPAGIFIDGGLNGVELLSSLEYSYLGATARENSGSVEQLLLDAGIKRDAKGYNIEANVDHETYFKMSEVSECSYSKKVGTSPATVITVVLGLIGGVTTSVSVFALVLYQLFRKSVFKKYKNEMQSKDPSSSVPV